jgi:hypothetical protein
MIVEREWRTNMRSGHNQPKLIDSSVIFFFLDRVMREATLTE